MDKETFTLDGWKAIASTPHEVQTENVSYQYYQPITINYNWMLSGAIQLQGKKLADFQKRQTAFNMAAERRLDGLEEENTALFKRVAKLEGRNNMANQETVLSLQCGRLLEELSYFRGLEDILEQLQYATLVLKTLDRMFDGCDEKTGRFHRQLILKLRSAIKLNCDKDLFTEKQIDMLVELAGKLRMSDLNKEQVLAALDRLMDVDLSPFPSLEDEDETVSGHDGSN